MCIKSDSDPRDSASKKLKTAALPSGLIANWKQKAVTRVSTKATAPASSSAQQILGGLDNEDADTVQPAFELSGNSRNKCRNNDVCS
jgi:hypothetical protein